MYSNTYFVMTKSVMLSIDQNLIIDISPNNKRMVISNISEATFEVLPFVTNSPLFTVYNSIDKIEYFINNNLQPTNILGASDICQGRFKAEDALAFISGRPTFTPFKAGFENNLKSRDMLGVLCSLSSHVANLAPTDTVKFRITMKSL